MFGASAILPAIVLALIGRYGWRATWAMLGLVVAITVSGLAWRWLHDRPEDLGLTLDGGLATVGSPDASAEPGLTLRDATRTRAYLLLASAAAVPPMVGTAVIFDIEPLMGAHGMDTATAVAAVSIWSATMGAMAIPAGYLVDMFKPGRLIAAGLLGVGGACGLLLIARTPWVVWSSMILMGLGHSLVGPTVYATTARWFGRRHHGAIRSSLARIAVIATGLGPFAFGVSQRFGNSHDAALIGFACTCMPIALACVTAMPPSASR
jgi:MFS family permease